MGYESKLYIVNKTDMKFRNNKKWAEIIAVYNLCKMNYVGKFHSLLESSPITDYYVYADDGNTEILVDKYGEELKEMTIVNTLKALRCENQDYRLIPPIIALLEALDPDDWGELAILHYGY